MFKCGKKTKKTKGACSSPISMAQASKLGMTRPVFYHCATTAGLSLQFHFLKKEKENVEELI
jgi:hypothetical protein